MDNYGQAPVADQGNFQSQPVDSNTSFQQPTEGLLGQAPVPQAPQPNWRDSLPEDLRNSSASKFDSLEKFIVGYNNLEKVMGRRAAEVPMDQWKQNFTPEEIGSFYRGLGVPEAPEQYKIDSLPEYAKHNPNVQEALKQATAVAHKLGISSQAMNEIVKMEFELHENARLNMEKQNFAALSNHYGRDLESANQLATDAVMALGGESLVKKLVASGMAHDPDVFGALHKLGQMMQTDRIPSNTFPSNGPSSPDELKAEIKGLYNDSSFYQQIKQNNPVAQNRLNELYSRLAKLESVR